ncbi:hypothetical protein A3B21_01980 [Candidatus Uhrbacteria bacterium RIFCSPLOWO2_01_FULL_47_24]|uniref:DUF5671 domain-containing protein n=1 Tax=Candidatus Uhrbacteria bacterium RIFCSPLOWO2_01_FULL_47_24 TaxID=1802401 RepID=A0A1F7UQW9_9BACT|nr:MAG: hypothetical protein A2753_01730 [Candidatus Uhrbacteria bacterium RIFCSPHIGHO2_01_FULL_47_11]OGL67938.1 MAG: hypothetical protein A3D58_05175 [Candidatus Uhrbacteria bacterium RIFCSPHIGHO2_02_FULL_46_47]OGL75208.1 MAG: hypothetical protein A3F52_04165 [Candidatus Uhrbacteria bacterium RIFCSPHIGHO2_12_FULL_47_11]OGL80124.1 MAG: hypothetical protein A3B21_01980 [Candidatus Uhrbacteria bacterium RIFCSPLOWO2_01_FULL_47_24]OGL84909.1 MAG: hypothetical protein A3J03_04360 [Candidatus Uhrbact
MMDWQIALVFAMYLVVGIVVMVRLEMRLTGMTWEEMRRTGSEDKGILFQTSSRVTIVLFAWPIIWWRFRKEAPHRSSC